MDSVFIFDSECDCDGQFAAHGIVCDDLNIRSGLAFFQAASIRHPLSPSFLSPPRDGLRAGARFGIKQQLPVRLELVRENIPHFDLQPPQNRFQFVEREMVLPSLDAVEGRVGNPDFPGEIRIRKIAPRLS